ncbi:argininosuccinate synthase [Egibacter rhizosphaerae]|uniref:Argininosuccinate synthase n=1 Tax=Egibacter rhizosphaerae TaxID=1670831 RepID=A0A411YK41_9ACTN|nr:argininosuccinate synthase [Egibacter rhizosphaerae]QBI21572.1 argininosuccinate synthase [Egibacter rhizosphaerae]
MTDSSAPRVVLAYSGGLDTSVAIRWLAEHKGYETIALAIDVGQAAPGEMDRVQQRALDCGAVESLVVDAKDEFADDFVAPAVAANALYMGKYPLVSALSRPIITRHLVRVAQEHGADAIAHGCTGKGNDQVRFEVTAMAVAPDLAVEAPIREWGLSRDGAIAWARERDIPIPVSKGSAYSIDENLWGRTAECGILEDPWAQPPEEVYERSAALAETPDEPEELTLAFEDGLPVALDGEKLALRELIAEVDRRAGRHGVGRIDMVEDRLVGIKSREIYECPGAVTILAAHRDLEDLCLEQELAQEKRGLESRYAQIVYNGLWYTPLKRAIDAFVAETQRFVAGEVRVQLFKGHAAVVGRRSERGLYDLSLATYDEADQFDQSQAEGFVKLWGLPTKVWAQRQGHL